MLGYCHEIMGPLGLVWHTRLLLIDTSLATKGACGFPIPIAEYLGKKYGYEPGAIDSSRERVRESFDRIAARLRRNRATGTPYLASDRLTALDTYCASALGVLAPLSDDICPLHPRVRHMYDSAAAHIGWGIPDEHLAHRDFVRQCCLDDG